MRPCAYNFSFWIYQMYCKPDFISNFMVSIKKYRIRPQWWDGLCGFQSSRISFQPCSMMQTNMKKAKQPFQGILESMSSFLSYFGKRLSHVLLHSLQSLCPLSSCEWWEKLRRHRRISMILLCSLIVIRCRRCPRLSSWNVISMHHREPA